MGEIAPPEMVPRGFRTVRAGRARALAERYPHSAEGLLFLARAFEWIDGHGAPRWEDLPARLEGLHAAVRAAAPPPLEAARPCAEDLTAYLHEPDPLTPAAFYARLTLEHWARHAPLHNDGAAPNECPRCGHAPQLGILRRQGDGDVLSLQCSLCRGEWPHRRTTCLECGETDPGRIGFQKSDEYPHIQTQTCDRCGSYFHLLLPERDPALIAEVDETAAQPLDLWASEHGFHKVWPNTIGL
jgi:hypothetical protein